MTDTTSDDQTRGRAGAHIDRSVVLELSKTIVALDAAVRELEAKNKNQQNAINIQATQITQLCEDLDSWQKKYRELKDQFEDLKERADPVATDETIRDLTNILAHLHHSTKLDRVWLRRSVNSLLLELRQTQESL